MTYAKNVYRVAKIIKNGIRYDIEMSVKGIEYPTIGTIYVKSIRTITSLEDNNTGKIQHGIHCIDFDDNNIHLVFDMVIHPDDMFTIDSIQDFPNGRITEYRFKGVA